MKNSENIQATAGNLKNYWREYRKARPGLYAQYISRNPEAKAKKKADLKLWCAQNKEKRRESFRRYRQAHPEIIKQRNFEQYHKNKEKRSQKAKDYRLKNRDERLLYLKRYYRNRYDSDPNFRLQYKLASDRRRALRQSVTINPKSILEFVKGVKSKPTAVCFYCGERISSKRIDFDHIIPLSKGGAHSVENLCVSCEQCNGSKHDKLVSEWMKLGQQILTL